MHKKTTKNNVFLLTRKELEMKSAELSELLGFSESYWSFFESGRRKMTMGLLRNLSKIYKKRLKKEFPYSRFENS